MEISGSDPAAAVGVPAAVIGGGALEAETTKFLSGAFSLFERLGTSVYKGVMFAAVGFAAELVGTALSKGLLAMRKKMDPEFETQTSQLRRY
ncbi:hypothetical protein HS088_TW05G00631 [Tripterygium wilfordii]|uniref:Uncharacterized protein n=1 Tax=Tripterygium wilfordii TaxID=458696 RepID=A0A7J7DNJ3_TRIWF|nr:hypothetical protein HS088_TW05G00631 [Tripterygium wilfordii]